MIAKLRVPALLAAGALAATAFMAASQHIPTQVSTHGPGGESSHFSGSLVIAPVLRSPGSTTTVTKDSRHLGMRGFTWCAQGPGHADFHAVGVWRTNAGRTSTATCPAHDIRVDKAGYQYYYWKLVISGITAFWQRETGTHVLYKRGINS